VNPLLVVSYGMGRDSTAMLVGMQQRGMRPDHIVFADVGAEKAATYAYLPVIQEWLARVGFPPVTVVRNVAPKSPYDTIEGNMVQNATLPGATFGKASCTVRWKIVPQKRHAESLDDVRAEWAADRKVVKLIGFEDGEEYRMNKASDKAHSGGCSPSSKKKPIPPDETPEARKKREASERKKAAEAALEAKRYEYRYPLIEWEWTLERCMEETRAAGLPVPPKSACVFCPNAQPFELLDMTPEERGRIVRVEVVAAPYNREMQGLWRTVRKSDGRPGSMTQWMLENGVEFVLPEEAMPLNPACARFKRGYTFNPPHCGPDLRAMLAAHGKKLREDDLYEAAEEDSHAALVASL
jgi:hypothetical protein